jgi:hypothetical protein
MTSSALASISNKRLQSAAYTQVTCLHPASMQAMALHDEVIRTALNAWDGYESGNEGDR